MKKNNKGLIFITGTIFCALVIIAIFNGVNYIENEGFNPSDDGVILAQSFRFLNGEIPHKDFISIRPVFSGILHSIHFFSPFPLMESSRIFVIFQFFTFSFIWAFILCRLFEIGIKSNLTFLLYFISLGIVAFLMNMNVFRLHPWTTIDGIFLSFIGFVFFIKIFDKNTSSNKINIYIILALIFVSLAALSRQSFLMPAFLMFGYVIYFLIQRRQYRAMPIVIAAGSLPFILYFFFLVYHDALPFFIKQMTGQTGIFQTGIKTFIQSFIHSKSLLLNLTLFSIIVFDILFKKNKGVRKKDHFEALSDKHTMIWRGIFSIYLCFTLFLSFYFFKQFKFEKISLELFWILFTLSGAAVYFLKLSKRQTIVLLFVLILAWCSSISLGANSPLFTTGILSTTIIVIIIFLMTKQNLIRIGKKGRNIIILADVLLVSALFLVALRGQRNFNCRDLPARYLTHHLGEIFQPFGGIKTNPITYDYYADFMRIYNSYDNIKDHFVFIPNNAFIYPILNSKNPFPLDWLQREEYLGSEDHLLSKINDVLDSGTIYLILDKYDSKRMAFRLQEMAYTKQKYSYLDFILKRCKEIPTDSQYFRVYQSIYPG